MAYFLSTGILDLISVLDVAYTGRVPSLSLSPALVLALVSLARVLVVEALNGRGPDCQQKRRTKRVLSKTEHGQRCETEFLCAESLLVIRYNLLSATAVERPVRFPMPAHRKSATKEAVMAP